MGILTHIGARRPPIERGETKQKRLSTWGPDRAEMLLTTEGVCRWASSRGPARRRYIRGSPFQTWPAVVHCIVGIEVLVLVAGDYCFRRVGRSGWWQHQSFGSLLRGRRPKLARGPEGQKAKAMTSRGLAGERQGGKQDVRAGRKWVLSAWVDRGGAEKTRSLAENRFGGGYNKVQKIKNCDNGESRSKREERKRERFHGKRSRNTRLKQTGPSRGAVVPTRGSLLGSFRPSPNFKISMGEARDWPHCWIRRAGGSLG